MHPELWLPIEVIDFVMSYELETELLEYRIFSHGGSAVYEVRALALIVINCMLLNTLKLRSLLCKMRTVTAPSYG